MTSRDPADFRRAGCADYPGLRRRGIPDSEDFATAAADTLTTSGGRKCDGHHARSLRPTDELLKTPSLPGRNIGAVVKRTADTTLNDRCSARDACCGAEQPFGLADADPTDRFAAMSKYGNDPSAGPLALVGGNELAPGNEPQDRLLIEAAGVGPAFVLATAAARQRPEMAVRHARSWFAGLGLDVEELPATQRSHVTDPGVAAHAREGRFFYLVGGDPGIVPATLAGTPVWDAVLTAWRAGAALAGSSAGAMALGAWTLVRGRYKGDPRRRYADALGLVTDLAVIPHLDTFGRRWVPGALEATPKPDVILLGLDERTAAVHTREGWGALGPGGVTVLTRHGETRFDHGAAIDGLPSPVIQPSP